MLLLGKPGPAGFVEAPDQVEPAIPVLRLSQAKQPGQHHRRVGTEGHGQTEAVLLLPVEHSALDLPSQDRVREEALGVLFTAPVPSPAVRLLEGEGQQRLRPELRPAARPLQRVQGQAPLQAQAAPLRGEGSQQQLAPSAPPEPRLVESPSVLRPLRLQVEFGSLLPEGQTAAAPHLDPLLHVHPLRSIL